MTSSLVSVVLPVFNAQQWLAATIASVLAQSWPRWELLIVDDGSTDRSAEIAARFTDPRITLVRQENRGASAARNVALAAARGDFIQHLDADDLLAPNKLEAQLARLASASPGTVASGPWGRFYGDDPPESARFVPEIVWDDFAPVDWLVTSALGGGMMSAAAWLVPRAVAECAGPWRELRAVNNDGEYFARVLLASDGVVFVPDARVYYRSGIGGWSGQRSQRAVEGQLEMVDSITRHVLAREDSPRTREAMATNYARFVYHVYPDHLPCVRRAESRVRELGGSPLGPPRGGVFGLVSRVTGWKIARRLQRLARRR